MLHRPGLIVVDKHQYGHAYIYGKPELGDTREAFVDAIQMGRLK